MGKALYRKYRPISLSSVIGQDAVVKPLSSAIESGNFSHAYIFTGPRGCGKTSVARIFAHEINGFPYKLEDSYVDIIEIDGASNTGIDNIRDLREKAMIAPTEGKYKVYIIDEFHMLSKSAFNALLKIMEEPPEHVIFLLATTNLEKVPVTITSRAQVFNFKLADFETIFKHLSEISKKEGLKISKEALEIIARRGGGSFRDSISLLDQISNLKKRGEEISAEDVDNALGLPEEMKIRELLSAFEVGENEKTAEILRDLINSGSSAENIAANIIERIVENPTAKSLGLVSKLFEVQYPFAEAKLLVAFLDAEKIPGFKVSEAPKVVLAKTEELRKTEASEGKKIESSRKTELLKKIEEAKKNEKKRADEEKVEAPKELIEKSLADSVIKDGKLDLLAYVKDVKEMNGMLGALVLKAKFKVSGDDVSIYPANKSHVLVLKSKNNLNVLREAAPGYQVTVVDISEERIPEDATFPLGEKKEVVSPKMRETIESISDIMGAGIKDASGDPF